MCAMLSDRTPGQKGSNYLDWAHRRGVGKISQLREYVLPVSVTEALAPSASFTCWRGSSDTLECCRPEHEAGGRGSNKIEGQIKFWIKILKRTWFGREAIRLLGVHIEADPEAESVAGDHTCQWRDAGNIRNRINARRRRYRFFQPMPTCFLRLQIAVGETLRRFATSPALSLSAGWPGSLEAFQRGGRVQACHYKM